MTNQNFKIDLNKVSIEVFTKLTKLDESFISTKNYMGIAYFWDLEYKFELREASIKERIKIHNKMLKNGLNVGEVSQAHKTIIDQVLNNKSYKNRIEKKYGK